MVKQHSKPFLSLALCALLMAVSAAYGREQIPEIAQKGITAGAASRNTVKLRLVAFTRSRRLVQDLTKKDFRIFQDKEEQEIIYFSSDATEPLYVGFLIDVSQYILDEPDTPDWQTISRVLRMLLRPEDRAFVATFNESVHLLRNWTSDFVALDDALRQASNTNPHGVAAVHDAIFAVCEEKFSGINGRKALIVISNSPEQSVDHTEEETLKIVDRTGTMIFPVLPWSRRLHEPPFGNLRYAQVFSNETGGTVHLLARPKNFEESLKGIGIALTHLYVLGYVPKGMVRDGRYHSVKVKCTRPGVKLIVREGYYASEE